MVALTLNHSTVFSYCHLSYLAVTQLNVKLFNNLKPVVKEIFQFMQI